MISCQQDFFPENLLGRIFFSLPICLQDFFFLKKGQSKFCKNVFTFTLWLLQ